MRTNLQKRTISNRAKSGKIKRFLLKWELTASLVDCAAAANDTDKVACSLLLAICSLRCYRLQKQKCILLAVWLSSAPISEQVRWTLTGKMKRRSKINDKSRWDKLERKVKNLHRNQAENRKSYIRQNFSMQPSNPSGQFISYLCFSFRVDVRWLEKRFFCAVATHVTFDGGACWYEGCDDDNCKHKSKITSKHPQINQQNAFRRKHQIILHNSAWIASKMQRKSIESNQVLQRL